MTATSSPRDRADRCPGVLRPWPADDGLLVRLRLIGGRVSAAQLLALADVVETYGDGFVRTTSRTNLQIRALPGVDGVLAPDVLTAIEATGLLPSRSHELVRNVMMSPQTGLAGGCADLRPVAAQLDALLCANAELAALPGRFLIGLDDGRGDVITRSSDLAAVAVSADTAQLRVGEQWGPRIPLAQAAGALVMLAEVFQHARGTSTDAAWHIAELRTPLLEPAAPDPRLPLAAPPLPFGPVPGGRHLEVPDAGWDRAAITELAAMSEELIVTPWRSVLVPGAQR